ncbi:MAG: hypothetical protein IPN69_09875 [Acidobacteria bacterium]|nr:hypothetical protein [Acidobacteriota bacterium]MBK8150057.1 hypothetical protein [Acidobacteriota bacterium]MBK8811024.1 hypothetical protein [Acidobacteriota bacterium]
MNSVPRLPVVLVFLFLSFVSGCVSGQKTGNSNNRSANTNSNSDSSNAKDNIEDLEAIIRLPFHPEEALYREEPAAGPEKPRKLTVVLKFSAEEANKIVETSAKGNAGQPFEIETESWFSPELVAMSQESGNETIKGTTYPATEFTQAPYNDGKVSRIEGTNFFIVELNAR